MAHDTASSLLSALLETPASSLPPALAPALTTLLSLQLPSSPPPPPNTRLLTQQLVTHLASHAGTLSFPLIALYAASYQRTNASLVRTTLERALSADEDLLSTIIELGPSALASLSPNADYPTLRLQSSLHLSLARSTPLLASIYGQSPDVVRSLCTWYERLQNFRPSSLAAGAPVAGLDAEGREWLEARLEILETLFMLLSAAFLDPIADSNAAEERAAFWEELEGVLKPAFEVQVSGSGRRPLVDRGLLGDLENYFGVAEGVEKLAKGDTRAGALAVKLRGLRTNAGSVDGLELLTQASGSAKGKGKASVQEEDLSHSTDLAISQILDVLPSLSPSFLRACLAHPSYTNSAEFVISALLEDSLPPELERQRDGSPPSPPRALSPPRIKTSTRHNIFDDRLDASNLRRGKATGTADALLLDRSFMTTSLKETIIARAEAESSDEDEETEAFLEDFDDPTRGTFVRDGGEGEEADEKEAMSGAATPVVTSDPLANPINSRVASMLEQAYIADPTLFERTSVMRRSKARVALREKTGLADEQIEGWKVMLERNPKKAKILQKHEFAREFAGNKVEAELGGAGPPPREGQQQGRGRGGRGGRGDGRGGRGRGDGGRAAHDRRQRGNDRKMAKVA